VKCALLLFEYARRILLTKWRRCANGSIAIGTSPLGSFMDQHGDAVDVSMEFPDDQAGEAFATRFDGQ
jgi:hypothetical protein